ncbi:MAG TPA: DUF4157 domain-containing protein [Chitinophagaceae bacterium]|nr:DUF4157 domain-containing protein [Chitinophagaceae bacterium]
MKIRIKENSFIARLAAAKLGSKKVAIVFGTTIHLHNTRREDFLEDKLWVCHELKHVEQYQKHGYLIFPIKYFIEWVRRGYYKNKFEVEARENEKNTLLLSKAMFFK